MSSAFKLDPGLQEADGIIERVDVPGRELSVRIGAASRVFVLAPGCMLLLHGEPVKLRLLQPLDRVHLEYAHNGEDLVAYRVHVR